MRARAHFSLLSPVIFVTVVVLSGAAGCDGCGGGADGEQAEVATEAPADPKAPAQGEGSDDKAKAGEGAKKKSTPVLVDLPKNKKPRPPAGRAGGGDPPTRIAGEPPAAGPMTPEEKRRKEREERIAQLKRRNEERRQERLAKNAERAVDERRVLNERSALARKQRPVLDVNKYLSLQDVRTLSGDRTLTSMGHLSGIAAGEAYNSTYFAPSVRANFGVALQVWKERIRRDANQRYTQMRADYPNAEDITALGGKSFISYFGEIMTLTFADLTKRVVVSVSCGQRICTGDQLLSMANAVKEKL